MIALISGAELAFITYAFSEEMVNENFNMSVLTWMMICFLRVCGWLYMCCDGIYKRRLFMWILIITTILEVVMFTILQMTLFDGNPDELIFSHMAGLSVGIQVIIIETLALLHLLLFSYFSAVAYEYYALSCDDPGMIDAEHKRRATKDK